MSTITPSISPKTKKLTGTSQIRLFWPPITAHSSAKQPPDMYCASGIRFPPDSEAQVLIVFITVVMSVFCHRAKFPMRKKRPSNSPFSDESDSLLSPPCADSCGFVHFESLIKILQHFLSRTLEDRLHSWICLKRILHDISH